MQRLYQVILKPKGIVADDGISKSCTGVDFDPERLFRSVFGLLFWKYPRIPEPTTFFSLCLPRSPEVSFHGLALCTSIDTNEKTLNNK